MFKVPFHLIGREWVATLRALELGTEPIRDALVMVAMGHVTGQRCHQITFLELSLADDAVFDAFKPFISVQDLRRVVQNALAQLCLLIIALLLIVEEVADAR